MRRLLPALVLVALALLAVPGCDRLQPFGCRGCTVDPEELAQIPLTPGIVLHEIELSDGREIDLAVSVPQGYTGGTLPLVLALHFATEPIRPAALDYVRFHAEPGLRDLDALIVAPDNIDFGLTWDNFQTQDVAASLLDAALEAWPVDPDRVIVTGYSDGGIGTWWMAQRYASRFSAAIPVAGVALESYSADLPVYVIHGRNDELFSLERVQNTVADLQDAGRDVQLHVTEFGHFEPARYTEALAEAAEWVEMEIWD